MIDFDSDFEVLAATLWGEARGEGPDGIAGVASVISNRVANVKVRPKRKQFGDGTFRGACLRPWQFSCWNRDDPNREKLMELDLEDPKTVELGICVEVAKEAIAGTLEDSAGGALFYKVSSLPWPRDWGPQESAKLTVVIGHHSFYNLKE